MTTFSTFATPTVYDIKIVKASSNSLEMNSSAEARFQVTMVDACYYNELTCDDLPDIEFIIEADNSSPGVKSQGAVNCA